MYAYSLSCYTRAAAPSVSQLRLVAVTCHASHNQPGHSVYCHGIPAHFYRVKCVRSSPSHDQDFQKHPSDFRSFLMVFRRLLNTAKNVQRCPDNDNDFSPFIMRLRTICVDFWVRCEKLSLMREINVFSQQAWDSHIMHECGQVQHGLRSQILTLRHETNTVSLSISQNYWRNWNLNVWKGLYTETAYFLGVSVWTSLHYNYVAFPLSDDSWRSIANCTQGMHYNWINIWNLKIQIQFILLDYNLIKLSGKLFLNKRKKTRIKL